ncbi:d67e9fe6-26a5-4d94-b41b-473921938291 [Sclerotinia trifoliorum]|uniref:D67e9fe6-26a5-4d94-b41b-473921938291 n=1 Tax=Sclerotinia trifoliorum TaxID=28548 RepID=A0A8H2ZT15_9HELO|nr:d67e9fe6-26a5-4d94-b41b-473921938291 [Sclerotinia trifoliorum]
MAANLNRNESVGLTGFINSDVVRELFAFCLGGILGLIVWFFTYFYMVDLVFRRIDGAQGWAGCEGPLYTMGVAHAQTSTTLNFTPEHNDKRFINSTDIAMAEQYFALHGRTAIDAGGRKMEF